MGRKSDFEHNLSSEIKLTSRNPKQKQLMKQFHDPNIRVFFALGPSGSGKTYMSVLRAMQMYAERKVNKIIISRPNVGADEDLGFLPGPLEEKMYPWIRPILDVMYEYWMPETVQTMLEQDRIEIAPLAYLRGRSFPRCAIILDEFQNSTISQMKMALTRLGEESYMFVTGDENQSDLKGQKNGLVDFCERLQVQNSAMISVCKFSKEHIVRDPVVQEVLDIYDSTDKSDVSNIPLEEVKEPEMPEEIPESNFVIR